MAGKRAIGDETDGITGGGAKGGTWPGCGPLTPWGDRASGGVLDGGGSGSEGAARAAGPVPWSPRRNSGITALRAAIAWAPSYAGPAILLSAAPRWRTSSIREENWARVRDWGPSERAASGVG